MTKINIYDIDGKLAGEVSVDSIPDGFEPDKVLIARSLKRQLANARIPCGHVKHMSDVSGGGRKPFRQKGLGRSRQGSIRSIQWTGGAVAFGPRRERNFKLGMNKKERKAALRQCIWSKIQDGDWLLFDDFEVGRPSTKFAKAWIAEMGREGKILVLLPDDPKFDNLVLSLRNLRGITILSPERVNTYDLLKNATVLAHKDAFETVRATWQV